MDENLAILRRYALGIWQRRWIALATAWLICIVGWLGVLALPPVYEADAEVAVAESALAPFLQGMTIGEKATHDAALMLQYTLLSRPSLRTLIDREGLLDARATPEARAALEAHLATNIQIVPVANFFGDQEVNRLFISYRNRDPKRAYSVVKGILGLFVGQTIGSNQTDLANARRFLDEQIASYGLQLRALEQRRRAFVVKYAQVLPGDNGAPSQFDRVRGDVQSLEVHLQQIRAQIAVLRQELAQTPETLAAGSTAAPANADGLAAAEQHLTTLRQQFTDAYPGVIEARRVVAALANGKGSGATVAAVPNRLFSELKLQLIDAHTNEVAVEGQLAAVTAERDQMAALANSNPNLLAEYGSLDRAYQVVRKQCDELLSRRASMEITLAATGKAHPLRLTIVNPPRVPVIPISPRRKLLLAGMLVAGLGVGAAVAFALAYADTCCHTVRELEEIGLPVIGGISLRRPPVPRRRTLPLFAFGGGLFLLVVAWAGVIEIGGHVGWGP